MTEALFVYGTLQPGASHWHLLEPATVGSPRPAMVAGTLYDTGRGYPALELGGGPGVPGWLVRLRGPDALVAADEYEGPMYERVRVTLDDGTVCWTYVWTGPRDGLTPHAGAWSTKG